MFANVPEVLSGSKKDLNERDLEKLLRDAGVSKNQAKKILAVGFVASQDGCDAQNDSQQDGCDAQSVDGDKATLRDVEPKAKVIEMKKKDRTNDLLIRAEELAPKLRKEN